MNICRHELPSEMALKINQALDLKDLIQLSATCHHQLNLFYSRDPVIKSIWKQFLKKITNSKPFFFQSTQMYFIAKIKKSRKTISQRTCMVDNNADKAVELLRKINLPIPAYKRPLYIAATW